VHQVGCSLYDYIEMHGQQNTKKSISMFQPNRAVIKSFQWQNTTYTQCTQSIQCIHHQKGYSCTL